MLQMKEKSLSNQDSASVSTRRGFINAVAADPRITTITKFGLAAFAMGTFIEASVSAKAGQLVWVRAQTVDHFRAVGLVPPLALAAALALTSRVRSKITGGR